MVEEVNSCMIYLIHCKNLCECHNVPPSITTIKKKSSIKLYTHTHRDREREKEREREREKMENPVHKIKW
jgi:hypothetical protein